MAKATSCKEAIANFEKAKGVVAAETDKVLTQLSPASLEAVYLDTNSVTDLGLTGFTVWTSTPYRQDGRQSIVPEGMQVSFQS